MRGLRSTLALIAVLIGLGAYIYFVTWKQTDDTASTQDKVFASLEADQIQEITVKSESGDLTTVRKEGDRWQIVSPTPAPASETEVSAVTSALQQLEIVRVVDENPPNLQEYGLDTPRVEVAFKTADGKTPGRLFLGAKTAAGGNIYARLNDEKRVFLIAEYQEPSLNKTTFGLRDKTLLAFQRDQLDGLELNATGKTIRLAKTGTDWRLTAPVDARADSSAAEGLVGRLETAQVQSIVTSEATPADLKKYGLERPATTVNLNLGSARATLAVGGTSGEDAFYARDVSKPVVVTIEKALVDELNKGANDYRRKDIFEFRAFNADRIELTRSAQTFVFERVKSGDESKPDTWKRVSPNPSDVEREKMENLLTSLADLRAGSFVSSKAGTGLDAPLLTVFVKFEEAKKEERVTLGKTGTGEFAATSDPGVAKLEGERLDEIVKTLDELSK